MHLVHRILSSAIFHNTFGHFLFDICLLLIFGVTCEHALGTIGILNATLFFQLISSLLRLCLHFVYPIKVCTTGFSGILFAYMMVSVYMETRHVKRYFATNYQ
jgi:membrane associated rhomboid family serine protease